MPRPPATKRGSRSTDGVLVSRTGGAPPAAGTIQMLVSSRLRRPRVDAKTIQRPSGDQPGLVLSVGSDSIGVRSACVSPRSSTCTRRPPRGPRSVVTMRPGSGRSAAAGSAGVVVAAPGHALHSNSTAAAPSTAPRGTITERPLPEGYLLPPTSAVGGALVAPFGGAGIVGVVPGGAAGAA